MPRKSMWNIAITECIYQITLFILQLGYFLNKMLFYYDIVIITLFTISLMKLLSHVPYSQVTANFTFLTKSFILIHK